MIIPAATLLAWYREGIFPMGDPDTGDITLHAPDPRAIIDLDDFHIPETLRKTIRSGRFEIRIDTAFKEVISLCARNGDTWIIDVIRDSYIALHRRGHAHSVEAWRDGTLAGGLYGVAMGGAFFGESMFPLDRDASKTALCALVERMRARGMTLLDTQYLTPHLARFGAREIRRSEYEALLRVAVALPVSFFP